MLLRSPGANQRAMISKEFAGQRLGCPKKAFLQHVFQSPFAAELVLIHRPRWVAYDLGQNSQITGLHQPPDGLPGVEVDVPHRVKNKIRLQHHGVFERYFDENVIGHPRSLIEQLPRILYVLDDMAQNREIKLARLVGDSISVEELTLMHA